MVNAARIDNWLFDLDNTLYPSTCNLFAEMDGRMRAFIRDALGVDDGEARRLQQGYYLSHGTTLRGLMELHGLAPEAFVEFVHDIDLSAVAPDPALDSALGRLVGRKIVFTNGSARHAERVLERLGVARRFEAVFDIAAANYVPKPRPEPYAEIVRRFALVPARTAMIDDAARNLAPAAALGMTTVWVRTPSAYGREGADGPHVHHVADPLGEFLSRALEAGEPR